MTSSHVTRSVLVLCALLAVASVGCKKNKEWGGSRLDPSVVEVATDRLHLRHVNVGMEVKHMTVATVVMVDVRNKHTGVVNVTLTGKLFDKDNKQIGSLTKQSLRIPKGKWRLFALVDSESKQRKQAVAANVKVLGVNAITTDQEVVVKNSKTHKDKHFERVILQADVTNSGKAFARTLVMCAFYDKSGTPITRPFSELRLKMGETKPVQFIGPEGSVRGEVFIGETFWH